MVYRLPFSNGKVCSLTGILTSSLHEERYSYDPTPSRPGLGGSSTLDRNLLPRRH
jgi:hypothetical protein